MDDLISRQAAIDVLKDEWVGVPVYYLCGEDIFEYSKLRIESLPSVQPRKGKWTFFLGTGYGNPYGHFECSLCGDGYGYKTNFCPTCGADMREG